jgi:hypothetical protein
VQQLRARLAASLATATMLLVMGIGDAQAAHHGHVAVSSGSTSGDQPYWPRHPCRNWHKICHPY